MAASATSLPWATMLLMTFVATRCVIRAYNVFQADSISTRSPRFRYSKMRVQISAGTSERRPMTDKAGEEKGQFFGFLAQRLP